MPCAGLLTLGASESCGGMGTMVPERREEIVPLGLKSILAGTLATCMTGAVVGMLGF
jgi:CNT family concentrative nucleoside transporter